VLVTALNVGWLTSPAGLWRRGDPLNRPLRFPIPAYLLETGTERVLIDTGLHPSAVDDPSAHYQGDASLGAFAFEQERSVAEQVDLQTLTRVVMTHLHFDHAGGLELLPQTVPVIVQRREWEGVHDPEAAKRNFMHQRDIASIAGQVVLVDGDVDLLGDGSIRLLSTPGHTPGHQSVQVGDTVIAGDVVHFSSTLDDGRFPAFADNPSAQKTSARRLRPMRDRGVTILPGHDPAVLRPGPIRV
jgi:N-acyl homoserine lactone hydrolase